MQIIRLNPGDTVELKKAHPCGSRVFKVMRVGSDVRIICTGCGRDMVIERIKLERAIKKVLSTNGKNEQNDNDIL